MACRTHWQAEEMGSEGVPEHFFNAPVVGTQLSWRPLITPVAKAVTQVAYEIEVWDSQNATAPQWTSGKVGTDAQTMALPASAALEADRTYGWRVRVWLSNSPSTEPTQWGCGKSSTQALFDTAPATSPAST